jgi:putative peptide zinc metalloprotease protein
MTSPVVSSSWYRIRTLRPRLRGHVRIHRHVYRGAVWYVIEDRVAGRFHRFNPAAYRVIALLDGRRDLEAIWDRLAAEPADDLPSQDEIVQLLGQLHGADLIRCDVTPDLAELLERRGREVRRKWLGRFANPVALRFPLLDPDRLLAAIVGAMPWLGTVWGAALWLAVVLPALILVPAHWPELTGNLGEQVLAAENLVLLALVFPLVKGLHELGHGVACKLRGGEVHEMGVMLLVLLPIPYVDASSASAFPGKWQRMLVGAAGMLTEVFLAALAFYLWLLLEPGLARAAAFNVMVLAGVTTLFFNANPLLRFDGYYILADWLEIPNLGARAGAEWRWLAERWLLGMGDARRPQAGPGERLWLRLYAPLAFAYRMAIMLAIALFVAAHWFFVGVLIALWGLVAGLGLPIYRMVKALLTGPQYADRGRRLRGLLVGGAAGLAALLLVVPVPYHTDAEGVVRLPEQAVLRAGTGGFVETLLAVPGSRVHAGQPVLASVNPDLEARLAVQTARLAEVRAEWDAARGIAPARANRLAEDLRREAAALARLAEERARLTLVAAADGELIVPTAADLPGRFLTKGSEVGWLTTAAPPLVRVALPQAAIAPVRADTRAVEVRLPQDPGRSWPARVRREVPAAGRELPGAALGRQAGGSWALDPRDGAGTRTLESLFELELTLPEGPADPFPGSRAMVRFEHPPEPIGLRIGRAVRRLFLSHFRL